MTSVCLFPGVVRNEVPCCGLLFSCRKVQFHGFYRPQSSLAAVLLFGPNRICCNIAFPGIHSASLGPQQVWPVYRCCLFVQMPAQKIPQTINLQISFSKFLKAKYKVMLFNQQDYRYQKADPNRSESAVK